MKNKLLSLPALILIFILWITPGLVARDPWKADEPYTFGLVHHIIQTGDWVVPTLTGEPFVEKPPIFFLTAAGFGRLFSPPLDLFAATRLACFFYTFLAFVFFALTARELYGKKHWAMAAMLLLGCVNLQVTSHKLITDVALFAGFSIALYGLALSSRRPAIAGLWIGMGTGLGFLSKGLIAPGILGLIAVMLPVSFRGWRRREYAVSLAIALAAALPWLLIWPAALYSRSPDLFIEWFWGQNFGRFFGFNDGSVGFHAVSPDSHSYYILNLIWLAWPVVLPALWSLWHFRRSLAEHPLFQVPVVAFIVMLVVLSVSATNRSLYALPMLLPLSLIALPGIYLIPSKAKAIGNRATLLLFGFVALVLWVGWLTMMTGSPAIIAQRLRDFQPDYNPSINGYLFAAAVLYTLLWLFTVLNVTHSHEHVAVNWTLGMVLAWGLVMTLWLPALNAGSSHRAAFTALKQSLPGRYSCVASRGVGESERAMLEYFAGIRARRTSGLEDCDLLLEQYGGQARVAAPGPEWQKIWEFRHPSSRPKDVFVLYKKEGVLTRISNAAAKAAVLLSRK